MTFWFLKETTFIFKGNLYLEAMVNAESGGPLMLERMGGP